MTKLTPKKYFSFFCLAFLAIIFITVFKYDSTNKAVSDAHEQLESEIDKPEKIVSLPDIGIPFLGIDDARKKRNSLFLDIRSYADYSQAHIRSSVHIQDFRESSYPNVKNLILIHDNTGNERTDSKLLTLTQSMPERFETTVLDGGFFAWQKEGLPIITQGDPDRITDLAKVTAIEPRDIDLTDPSISFLDTRQASAFEVSHVPGAMNISHSQLEKKFREIPQSQKLYVYNSSELESFYSAVLLFDLGFVEVQMIRGGFAAWKEYGYPTE